MLKSKSYNSTLPTRSSYSTLISFESGINLTDAIALLLYVKGTFKLQAISSNDYYYFSLGNNLGLVAIECSTRNLPKNYNIDTYVYLPFHDDNYSIDDSGIVYKTKDFDTDENSQYSFSLNTNNVTNKTIDINVRSLSGNFETISFNGKFELWGVFLP